MCVMNAQEQTDITVQLHAACEKVTSLKSSEESLHKEQTVANSKRPSYSPHWIGLSPLSLEQKTHTHTNRNVTVDSKTKKRNTSQFNAT